VKSLFGIENESPKRLQSLAIKAESSMDSTAKNFTKPIDTPEFFNIWCYAAVGLFALNNHFLKFHYHNWLTGKLSDFAACFFLPLFISAVLALFVKWPLRRRVLIGAIVTVLIFSVVKLSPSASSILNNLLSFITLSFGFGGSNNTTDVTDLIALPMVGVAYYFAAKR
jgi:hypothetical protein